ncbi:MAG: hypothetical protein M1828_004161 [Chrysothrix sp. TS-e1954]|nr:MAG: hypothetical protein M1828_004161 [Chrysothrix sp. TS-e1954]
MESEPQSPRSPASPDRSFHQLLPSRSKKGGKVSPSRASLAESDAGERLGLRSSIGSSIDKLKDIRRGSSDSDRRESGDSGGKKRLSRLVKKGGSRSRSKHKSRSPDKTGAVDAGPGLGLLGEDNSKLNIHSINASTESFGRQNKSGGSSLLTEDSEPETTSDPRPALNSRASHAGYLTFTSPLIAAETVETSDAAADLQDSSEPQDLEPISSKLSDGTTSPVRPSSTTGDKLRGVFSKSSSSKAIGSGGETDPARSGGGGSSAAPLGGLFGGSKKSSAQRQDSGQEGVISPSGPQASLRSLSTNSLTHSETPSTVVTPPSPVVQNPAPSKRGAKTNLSLGSISSDDSADLATDSSSASTALHRRTRSATTAKTATLPPTLEELKTPGGSLVSPGSQNNFFSSFFSATQNAVAQISNSIANQANAPSPRSRSGTDPGTSTLTGAAGGEEVIPPKPKRSNDTVRRESALATLGSGNLSLSHLGINDSGAEASSASSRTEVGDEHPPALQNGQSTSGEESHAADAISAAYAEKAPSQKSFPIVNDTVNGIRPRSRGSTKGTTDEISPPRSQGNDGSSIHRASSVRSRLSRPKKKRGRGSTAGSGGAIAAALAASHGTIAAPARRTTGFDLANAKRNKDFHGIFKSIPEADHLIEDYSAALQRDILLHGRLYVSERHICFSSNILGWITNLVVSFDEVVSMEKKSTAVIFPNAIVIQTLHAKNVFASFLNRYSTYDLLIGIWKVGHPNLKSSVNGHALDDSGNGDKVEVAEETETEESEDESEEEDEEAEEYDDSGSVIRAPSVVPSEVADLPRNVTQRAPTIGGASTNAPPVAEPTTAGGTAVSDLAGPSGHAPTECSDQASHYDKPLLDTTIAAPLGKMYSMMFGPASGPFMRSFLIDDQKCTSVKYEDDKKGMDQDNKTYSYSYIKPLNASFGPKSTQCNTEQTLDAFDLEKAVSVTLSTSTPDVPSGNVFVTKTRYCLMWGPNNTTRLIGNCTIEWSGKSWLKGPIEKGAFDGQFQYGKDILEFIQKQLAAGRSPAKAPKGKVKGKKKRTSPSASNLEVDRTKAANVTGAPRSSNWGPLEPLHGVLGPIGGLLGPVIVVIGSIGVIWAFMALLGLRLSWSGSGPAVGTNPAALTASPQRLAAYEELWRREESQLWDWLEDRVRMDEIPLATGRSSSTTRQPPIRANSMGQRLDEERMSERQVDDAIRVTEERLDELKAVVNRKRSAKSSEKPEEKEEL